MVENKSISGIFNAFKKLYIRSDYRFNKSFFRAFRMILIGLALPLMVMIIVVYFYSQSNLMKEMEAAAQRSLLIPSSILNQVMDNVQTAALQISVNETADGVLRMGQPVSYTDYARVRQVMSTLDASCQNAFSESAYIYNAQSNYFITNSNYASRAGAFIDMSAPDVLTGITGPNGTAWQRRMLPQVYGGAPIAMLTFFRRVDGPGIRGLIAINIPENNLRLFLNDTGQENVILIVDGTGQILFDNTGRYGGEPAMDVLGQPQERLFTQNQGVFTLDFSGEKSIVAYGRLRFGNLTCLFVSPNRAYGSDLARLRLFVVMALTLGILLSIVIAVLLGVILSRPIRQIVNFIDSQHSSGAHMDNELQYILMHMISIYDENRQLEQERLSQYSVMRQAQATALQAQITPHFLHNTLQAVQWLILRATGNENDPAVQSIIRLSDMARQTMAPSGSLVPLCEELGYVNNYMALQSLRYRDTLIYSADIQEKFMGAQLPRISIQPLVENSITHNQTAKGRECRRIRVFARDDGEYMVLGVEDNGAGMSREALDAYNKSFVTEGYKFEQHIGLGNLNQRILLLFGDKYHLFVETSEMGGLCVKMLLPPVPGNSL